MANDVLELLLPDAHEVHLDLARRFATYARLLTNDARPARGGRVAIDHRGVARELSQNRRADLRLHLVGLLTEYLAVCAGRGSWFTWARLASCDGQRGEPTCGDGAAASVPKGGFSKAQEHWSALEQERKQQDWLAGVPAPGETPLEVSRRLLECLRRALDDEEVKGPCATQPEALLWEARYLGCAAGPLAGEEALSALIESTPPARLLAAAVRDGAESRLSRGAVSAARDWLEAHSSVVAGDPDSLRLLGWIEVLAGRMETAQALLEGVPGDSRTLPRTLSDLSAVPGPWSQLLIGAHSQASVKARSFERLQRSLVGAVVLAVFRLEPDRALVTMRLDVAPGLRARAADWLAGRDRVWTLPGCAEHRLVSEAAQQVVRVSKAGELQQNLAHQSALSLALVPICGADGEVAGWLHLEFDHLALPTREELNALAVLAQRDLNSTPIKLSVAPKVCVRTAKADPLPNDPRGESLARFMAGSGVKLAQRRWCGFSGDCGGYPTDAQRDGRLLPVGAGGAAIAVEELAGEGRGLERVRRTGAPLKFETPDPELAVHAKAASGALFPIRFEDRVLGVLALESTRRRDFTEDDLIRLQGALDQWAADFRLAQFRAWHREHFGVDPRLDPLSPGFARNALDFVRMGRSSSRAALFGPPGAGKAVLARWMHFESGAAPETMTEVRARSTPEELIRTKIEQLMEPEGTDDEMDPWAAVACEPTGNWPCRTLLISGLGDLAPWLQGLLVTCLDKRMDAGRGPFGRLIVTLDCSLSEAAERGEIDPGLVHRLDRLQFEVPGLNARRAEVPALADHMLRRCAEEEGKPARFLSDAAHALLWRQPWPGNMRELENLIYKLVALESPSLGRAVQAAPARARYGQGEMIGPEDLAELVDRFGGGLLRKFSSRQPKRNVIVEALQYTAKQTGNFNKTRAALYLGWDPDTLAARMQDLKIESCDLKLPEAGRSTPGGAPESVADKNSAEPQPNSNGDLKRAAGVVDPFTGAQVQPSLRAAGVAPSKNSKAVAKEPGSQVPATARGAAVAAPLEVADTSDASACSNSDREDKSDRAQGRPKSSSLDRPRPEDRVAEQP